MANRKPLVLAKDGSIQQLQVGDEADIPLELRVQELEARLNVLVDWLLQEGFELPEEIITDK